MGYKTAKLLSFLLLFVLSSSVFAQGPEDSESFDPYDTDYPRLKVYTSNSYCGAQEWHDIGNEWNEEDETGVKQYPSGYVQVRNDNDIHPFCWNADGTYGFYYDLCKADFKRAKDKITSPCEYIVGVKSFVKRNTSKNKVRKCYEDYPVGDCPYQFCEDRGADGSRKNDRAIIQFYVTEESDCTPQNTKPAFGGGQITPTCAQCLIDGCNEDSDDDECNPPTPPDPPQVTPLSQGCIPDTSKEKWKDISIDGFIKLPGGAGIPSIDISFPKCLNTPPLPPPGFEEFERDGAFGGFNYDALDGNYSPFGEYASLEDLTQSAIDDIDYILGWDPSITDEQEREKKRGVREYNSSNNFIGHQRRGEWAGNCGRGMFLYEDKQPHHANFGMENPPYINPNDPDDYMRIGDNDIWESKTGCYNPEERFVHIPPFKHYVPDITALGNDPAGGRIKFYEPNAGYQAASKLLPGGFFGLPLWGSGSLIDGPWDEPVGATAASDFFIPNDRVLMEHPLCVKPYNSTTGFTPNGVPVGIRTTIEKMQEENTLQNLIDNVGSMPRCLTEDTVDDMNNFCEEYFKDALRINNDKLGNARWIGKYLEDRYYFDYNNFCWTKTVNIRVKAFDPYERWMPLAIRTVKNPTDRTQLTYPGELREDIYGIEHEYIKTDLRRPTFTPYAERSTYEYGAYDLGNERFSHEMYSLEEYGYRDVPHMRTDYQFNPINIYNPYGEPIAADKNLLYEHRGRKDKMKQCLSMFIEQWAFEGDKGAIVLDRNEISTKGIVKNSVNTDVSMCQWVAYYDTSANYVERKTFQDIMKGFLAATTFIPALPTENPVKPGGLPRNAIGDTDPGGCLPAAPAHLVPNPLSRLELMSDAELRERGIDPQQNEPHDSKCRRDAIKAVEYVDDNNDGENDVDDDGKAKFRYKYLSTQNYHGFVRKKSLRPEAFDYINFLTFSAIPTPSMNLDLANPFDSEKYSITHRVGVSGGKTSFFTLYGGVDMYGYFPEGADILGEVTDAMAVNNIMFASRQCKTAIPPHFWKDVINPFAECTTPDAMLHGARSINEIDHWLQNSQGPGVLNLIGNLLGTVVEVATDFLDGCRGNGCDEDRDHRHYLTTLPDVPLLSILTPIPTMPTVFFWYNNVDDSNIWSPDGLNLPDDFIDSNWETFDWEGSADMPLEIRDNWYRDGATNIMPYHMAQPTTGNDPLKLYYSKSLLGIPVIDEDFSDGDIIPRGRRWVSHLWPARSCMHHVDDDRNPLNIIDYVRYANDPERDPDNFLRDSWEVWDDIRLNDFAREISEIKQANQDLPTIGIGGGNDAEYEDNKIFGGFKVKLEEPEYFEWLPTKWSLGVGINRNFWCEFETPYFPYFVGQDEYDHNKKPFDSYFFINGKSNIFAKKELKKFHKPVLQYYRVESIRNSCGPFGIRSTWIDDPNLDLSDWLIGDYDFYKQESRCTDWYETYRRKTNDPKIIAWRLPRFDYEFLKSFLECTGPIREEPPQVCNFNVDVHDYNNGKAACEAAKWTLNFMMTLPPPFGFGMGDWYCAECIYSLLPGIVRAIVPMPAGCLEDFPAGDPVYDPGPAGGHYVPKNDDGMITKYCYGETAREKMHDNVLRYLDYISRGDTAWKEWQDDEDMRSINGFDVAYIKGYVDNPAYHGHSVRINKFWQRGPQEDLESVSGDDSFGFWCKCSEEDLSMAVDSDARTTRCREDICTCEQHVLFPGRHITIPETLLAGTMLGGTILAGGCGPTCIAEIGAFIFVLGYMSESFNPVAICKDYGPYRRWKWCYENALASSCPVVTREASDGIPYSTLKDPFQKEKFTKSNIPENTQLGQGFNVCTGSDPIGSGNQFVEGFIAWEFEEPNHLARIPAWFESAGGGYAHEDLVFQSQVRDFGYPFMELAVPFPIDLITRDCRGLNSDGTCNNDDRNPALYPNAKDDSSPILYHQDYTNNGLPTVEIKGNKGREINSFGDYTNNLGEIKQREGIGYSSLTYSHPDGAFMFNEFEASNKFRSRLLKTAEVRQMEPIIRTNCSQLGDCDSDQYQSLYRKYIEGLYTAAAAYSHKHKPEEPWNPTFPETKNQNIHPRAQDKIVGPRGCDVGGWYEMMLYQARCIKWHKLNCICDYDKTFAAGNAVNYALREAGMQFKAATPSYKGVAGELTLAADEKGNVYTVRKKTQKNRRTGAAKIKTKILGSNGKNVSRKISYDDLTPLTLKTDDDGNIIIPDWVNAKSATPTVIERKKYYPLADRGIAGPEFAPNSIEEWPEINVDNLKDKVDNGDNKFKLVGLDNVQVGDLIIWDEEIRYSDIDVGYPRHVAYVESVDRVGNGTIADQIFKRDPISITVSEMNWGKYFDSCANTNRWGVETKRKIFKPICSNAPIDLDGSPSIGCEYGSMYLPDINDPDRRIPGTIDLYASCQNADWAVCVEKYWNQVKIYRSFTSTNGTTRPDNIVYDTGYYTAECESQMGGYNTDGTTGEEFPKQLNVKRQMDIIDEIVQNVDELDMPGECLQRNRPGVSRIDVECFARYVTEKYNEGDLTLKQIIEDTDVWKILGGVSSRASYPYDEVQEFLFNPLNGYADVCDPPVQLRANFQAVANDVLAKCGAEEDGVILPCVPIP